MGESGTEPEEFPGGFTVLMSVCGRDDARLFTRAVASVFENDLEPDHMVLVVDGPVDETIEQQVGAAEKSYGVEVVRLARNRGLANALNAGLAHIKTKWIVRADADDYNTARRFRRMAEYARRNPEVDLFGSAILEVDAEGTPLAVRQVPSEHGAIVSFLLRRNPFNHMTVAFKRGLIEGCGEYPDIYGREDYGLWAKMVTAGARCANLPEILVHATAGTDLYCRRGGLRYVQAERDLQILMVRLGLKSQLQGLLDGVARSSVFIAPVFLRRRIYETLLRRPPLTRS
jgi:hypothetical protein